MIKELLNIVFSKIISNNNKNAETFLSKSFDHYDLDYRIKYLDKNK